MDAIRAISSHLVDAVNLADNECHGFDGGPTPQVWLDLVKAIEDAQRILNRIEHADEAHEAMRYLSADRANDEAWEDGRR